MDDLIQDACQPTDNQQALDNDRVWLRWRRSASTTLYRWAGSGGVLLFIAVLLKTGDWNGLGFAMLLFVGTLALEYLDRGYRISYDENAVYMRPHGIGWTLGRRNESRITFSDIVAVTGERSARSISYNNRFTPFEYVQVHSHQGSDEPFAFVGGELYDEDLRELLHLIDAKAPDVLDDDVHSWLTSDRRF